MPARVPNDPCNSACADQRKHPKGRDREPPTHPIPWHLEQLRSVTSNPPLSLRNLPRTGNTARLSKAIKAAKGALKPAIFSRSLFLVELVACA
jgi:hypothetical protein